MENRIEYIERYFNGGLNKVELEEFNRKRSTDKTFDQEVRLYVQANEIIKIQARNRLKKRLDSIGSREVEAGRAEPFGKYQLQYKYILQMAASIIVLAGAGYLIFNGVPGKNQNTSLADLYDSYYQIPGTDQVTTRGADEDSTTILWNAALEKYSTGDFRGAARDFKALLNVPDFKQKSAANFYTGICYLNLNVTDSAVTHLQNVSPSSSFSDEALWYQGLGYIQAGNSKEAAEVFNDIKETENHPEHKKAAKLVKQLYRLEKSSKAE